MTLKRIHELKVVLWKFSVWSNMWTVKVIKGSEFNNWREKRKVVIIGNSSLLCLTTYPPKENKQYILFLEFYQNKIWTQKMNCSLLFLLKCSFSFQNFVEKFRKCIHLDDRSFTNPSRHIHISFKADKSVKKQKSNKEYAHLLFALFKKMQRELRNIKHYFKHMKHLNSSFYNLL